MGGTFLEVVKPTEIFPGGWLTGPVPRTYPERNWTIKGKVRVVERGYS
jgi:7,8-dihydropterin-6-yl-methyl-4-(beta-D-ribofuranosyl)aminobenzene 5'-phosphate synthase